jgi:putative ABC transport system permease protein
VLIDDLRYSFRMMRRTPMFTAAVILTVALAIAANTAIFSVVNAVMLRPLPFAQPDGLIQVAEKNDKLKLPSFGASVLNFLSWREQTQAFEELAAIGSSSFTLTGAGEAEQFAGNRISPALTHVLGVAPILGRAFTADEEKPSAAPVAMIGEGLWKRRFGADPKLLGHTITLNGAPTTVVGIAPAALNLITGGDIYTPLTIDPSKELRLNHVIFVVGRLKPGISLRQAQAEMDTVSAHVGQQYPEVRDWGIHLITLFDTFVSPQLETGLLVLFCAVGFVLLIACANIANLLLARAVARQKEIAVRTAMGAGRNQVFQQLLTESIALSVIGGTIGVLGAFLAVRAIDRFLPPNLLPVSGVYVDGTVLWFAFGLTIATGVLFGIAPAWRMSKVDLNEVLKQTARGSDAGVRARLRNSLAASELALATMLLIGAGLLIQSLARLQRVHLGFESRGLITFQLAPPAAKYPFDSKAPQLYRALIDSLQSSPGVRSAAISSGIPFGNGNYTSTPIVAAGQSVLPSGTAVPIDWRIVSPGYFKTMRIPLLAGRDFTDADNNATLPVTVVSEATAKKFWGDSSPIGRAFYRSAVPKTVFTVVGVVADVRNTALNQESPAVYYPMAWHVWPLMDVAVRSEGAPEALLPTIRQRVHELDAELALANVRTMDEWISNNAAQPRLNATLLGIFAAMALLIAAIGIYGILAYSVNQRTREIGVRMALGAQRSRVLRLIVGEGMVIAMLGVGAGLLGSIAVGRLLSSLVYGVSVHDPETFAGVAVLLTIIAVAACAIPAHRASRVEPIAALRHE